MQGRQDEAAGMSIFCVNYIPSKRASEITVKSPASRVGSITFSVTSTCCSFFLSPLSAAFFSSCFPCFRLGLLCDMVSLTQKQTETNLPV